MALLILLFFVTVITPSQSTPQKFLLNLTKDPKTHHHTTQLLIGTTQHPTKLILHLSGQSLHLNCPPSSPSRTLITHRSLQCSMAKSHSSQIPSNGLCHVPQQNPITGDVSFGNLVQDKVSVENGFGQPLLTVDGFLFSCSKEVLVKGLVNGVKGVLGFGRSNLAFQSQMVNSFGFERKFLVCLSSKSNGFISSGVGMISNSLSLPSPLSLSYTPLEKSQKTHDVVDGYYVNVNSIKVNGRRLAVDQPIGAVEISSTAPYTVLKSTVYETLKKAFSKSMTMVAPVGPFGICFRSRVDVPVIELVMQSEMVKWRIHGRNLVVDVGDGVMCLGIVDGGLGMNGTMILGGYQLEDHVLEFNLGTSMMGFSSSLLMEGNSCSNIRETVSKSIQSL